MAWIDPVQTWNSNTAVTASAFVRVESNILLLRSAVNIILFTKGTFSSSNVENALHELHTLTR